LYTIFLIVKTLPKVNPKLIFPTMQAIQVSLAPVIFSHSGAREKTEFFFPTTLYKIPVHR
jgi:hypothetical protein